MSNTITETSDWTAFYRTLTTEELIARSLNLEISVKRGHALYAEERFAALEAEQARRVAKAASAAYWKGIDAADQAFNAPGGLRWQ
jgi:hypothetical protein